MWPSYSPRFEQESVSHLEKVCESLEVDTTNDTSFQEALSHISYVPNSGRSMQEEGLSTTRSYYKNNNNDNNDDGGGDDHDNYHYYYHHQLGFSPTTPTKNNTSSIVTGTPTTTTIQQHYNNNSSSNNDDCYATPPPARAWRNDYTTTSERHHLMQPTRSFDVSPFPSLRDAASRRVSESKVINYGRATNHHHHRDHVTMPRKRMNSDPIVVVANAATLVGSPGGGKGGGVSSQSPSSRRSIGVERKLWTACYQVHLPGGVYIGTFDSREKAECVYDLAALKLLKGRDGRQKKKENNNATTTTPIVTNHPPEKYAAFLEQIADMDDDQFLAEVRQPQSRSRRERKSLDNGRLRSISGIVVGDSSRSPAKIHGGRGGDNGQRSHHHQGEGGSSMAEIIRILPRVIGQHI